MPLRSVQNHANAEVFGGVQLYETAHQQGDNSIVIQYVESDSGARLHHTTGKLDGKDSVERGKNCIEMFRQGATPGIV